MRNNRHIQIIANTYLSVVLQATTASPLSASRTVSTSPDISPVAGGSAAGQGLNTSLFTATTSSGHASVSVYTSTSHYNNGTFTRASTIVSSSTVSATSIPTGLSTGDYTNWSVFKGNGVNFGAWLEQEKNLSPTLFSAVPDATDEWTLCEALGSECGPILEDRYATFITTADIDKLAIVGKTHSYLYTLESR
jgi:Tfp pilus assembly protein PilV